MSLEDIARRMSRSFQRKAELCDFFAGLGELTEEEQIIADSFHGPNAKLFAQKAISLHRQSQALSSMTDGEPKTESEVALTQDINNKVFIAKILSINRMSRLRGYVNGDEDGDINLGKSGQTTAPAPADSTTSDHKP